MRRYVPEHGDLIALTFDPQAGHEQKGRRPALVISKAPFHRATGLAICCPVTNARRGSRFHIPMPPETGLTGFIMSEQVKSVDYRSRRAEFIAKAPVALIDEVLAVLDAVMYPQA